MSSIMETTPSVRDAEWKRIQEKTFTNWVNFQLLGVGKEVRDLTKDLSDGVNLLLLLEVLSGQPTGKYYNHPTTYAEKMENVGLAMRLITIREGIKVVNIGNGDIISGNLKLILGLIWSMILHYSIIPAMEGNTELSAEQFLVNWLREKISDFPIKNLTTDWNDGKAIGALVDSFRPGLCPDWRSFDPEEGKENIAKVMYIADWELKVPQVLASEDMANCNVDELSVITYLSQFLTYNRQKPQVKSIAYFREMKNRDEVDEEKDERAEGNGETAEGNDERREDTPEKQENKDLEEKVIEERGVDRSEKLDQNKTFSRWINYQLRGVKDKKVEDLAKDLSDGVILMLLLEVLTKRPTRRFNKRAVLPNQKMENVFLALDIVKKEGIELSNIDRKDIVSGSLTVTLDLIWKLILHFSILLGIEGEKPTASDEERVANQFLLQWFQGKVPDMTISSFTTGWSDGKAIGALVDAVSPGLCPDWRSFLPENAVENIAKVMDIAEQELNVPLLLTPEEMSNPYLDDRCVMTYLAQFLEYNRK
ncbi:hypothetical protein RRG08_019829 [Elysia crispata]|uniref:Calponin-homology (CH) domain-containing protein n=1 Tax=Elysia crispata TaxID=231223 RepID=A0AAE0YDT7_9GAST|nr:hypothetical protein RRG08_019829 [Elysia crispata]